jgi:hypothetical protein
MKILEMPVTVHKAGHHCLARHIDDLRTRRNRYVTPVSNSQKFAILNKDHRVGERGPARAVD